MNCIASILTQVALQNRKSCFYLIKYYCTNSISKELHKFVQQQNFASNCELWRKREVGEQILADVYDGNL